MFTELSQLINRANLKNLSLMVQDGGNGNLNVVVMTENNVGDAADASLRAALSQPLKLQASPTLLDDQFITHLNSFSDSYVDAAVKANTAQASSNMNSAVAATESTQKEDPVSDVLDTGDQGSEVANSLDDIDLD